MLSKVVLLLLFWGGEKKGGGGGVVDEFELYVVTFRIRTTGNHCLKTISVAMDETEWHSHRHSGWTASGCVVDVIVIRIGRETEVRHLLVAPSC